MKILKIIDPLVSRFPIGFYILLGGGLALSQPPVHAWFLPFLIFPYFWSRLDQVKDQRYKVFYAWAFGFGYALGCLYWITFSLFVDIKSFFWLIPFTVFGLPAFLGIFPGMALAFTSWAARHPVSRPFIAAASWSVMEWFQGHIFTGFPWNLLGYTWASMPAIQLCAIFGIYGLSFLTVLCAHLLQMKRTWANSASFVALGIVFTLSYVYEKSLPPLTHTPHKIRIVQPNIPQSLKWDPDLHFHHLQTLLYLTQKPRDQGTRPPIILWPESATAYFLEHHHTIRAEIAKALPKDGFLITGGVRAKINPKTHDIVKVWNSLLVLSSKGHLVYKYDKMHLAPFGEYIPFRTYLPHWIQKLTPGDLDYTPGTNRIVHSNPQSPPFLPLICYEAIFPDELTYLSSKIPPEWIAVITNDGWFGASSAAYQHLVISRTRCIEQGLPMVRAAYTGISAVISAYGEVMAHIPLKTRGVLDTYIPEPRGHPTLFHQHGHRIYGCILFLCLAIGLILEVSQRALRKTLP